MRYPYAYGPYQLVPREWSVVRRVLDGRRLAIQTVLARVGGLSELRLNEDRWRSRSNYSLKRQHCLARIDIAVATSS